MRMPRISKEVSIRLADDEHAFVCTVLYGGVLRRTTRVSLGAEAEPLPDPADESALVLRSRRRSSAGTQQQD
jgi:hypothetical protein